MMMIGVYTFAYSASLSSIAVQTGEEERAKAKAKSLFYDFFDGLLANISILEDFSFVASEGEKIWHQAGFMLFSIVSSVMLMNLLIAILTNIYDELMG